MQLSSIFSDGVVLQRRKPITLRGYARGNQVTVTFDGKVYKTPLLEQSYFELRLPAMEAGGPYEIVLYDGERSVISDIMIGDVWVLGGQSNMELPVIRTLDMTQQEVKDANNPNIRMFQVPKEYCFAGPKSILEDGSWIKVNPKSVMDFSAAGYFLANYLYETDQIPIGLVHTAIGGTPIEAWMSEESLKEIGGYDDKIVKNKNNSWVKRVIEEDSKRITNWHKTMREKDLGIKENWHREDKITKFTKTISIPGMWENTELDGYKGSVWFTKEFEVPKEWTKKEVLLRLGAIIDGDETYVNGVMVGHTDYRYPPRKYVLPPNLLQEGKNTVTIRMFSDAQPGGFMPDKQYGLQDQDRWISLEGEWKYRIGSLMERLEPQTFFQYEPAGVFNQMIAPLKDLGICAIAFYQGESNQKSPNGYADKMEKMIQVWRKVFNQGDVPFLYVQLAYFTNGRKNAVDERLEQLRKEQKMALRIPNTAMIDAYDIGEYNDLHPQNKKEVGRRLFMAARKLVFHEDIIRESNIMFHDERRNV